MKLFPQDTNQLQLPVANDLRMNQNNQQLFIVIIKGRHVKSCRAFIYKKKLIHVQKDQLDIYCSPKGPVKFPWWVLLYRMILIQLWCNAYESYVRSFLVTGYYQFSLIKRDILLTLPNIYFSEYVYN